MTLNKKLAALFSMLLFAASLIIGTDAVAQIPDFANFTFLPGDTITIVIPDTVGVQADWDSSRNRFVLERLHTNVTTTEITEPGFYRIVIKILYNSGDEQTNETFYMTVLHEDGTVVTPADSNAGPYKIVFDDPGPRHTAWRDAGLFYFAEGQNTMQMHHVAYIMDEYPELLDGPLGPSESVKVTDSLMVIQELAPQNKIDLAVSLKSTTDSTILIDGNPVYVVQPGGNIDYTLTVFNNSPGTAENVTITDLLPAEFNLQNINRAPTRTSGDSLIWEFPFFEPNSSRLIIYNGTVNPDIARDDSLLVTRAELYSPEDSTAFNNTANDTVRVVFPAVVIDKNVDLSISLISTTDSTFTRNGKKISFTHPGGDVEYTLTVFNQTPRTARDITLVNVISPYFNISDMSRTPTRVAGDSLIWELPSLSPFGNLQIVYSGTVHISFPENDSLLIAVAEVFSPNDTTEFNNTASDSALVKTRENIAEKSADVGVTLVSHTSSSVVLNEDTLNVTFPGGLIEYTLTVYNNGPDSATNIILTNLLAFDFALDELSRTPEEISGDLLTWNIPVMAPDAEIEILYNGSAASGLSQDDLIISTANVAAPFDTTIFNNSDSDTVVIQIPTMKPPEIEATPAQADVTDSIRVRIQIPPNTATWDLWIRFPGGEIVTDFADDFISANNITPEVWYEVDENYNPEFLITTANREPLVFEIRAIDIFGNEASAQSRVEVISSNYLVLDRNVFRPEAETPLGIRFKLSNRRVARLDIYDIAGRHITKLTEDVYQGGWNIYPWDGITETGQRAGSGVYLVTLRSGEFNSWKKFIIVR